MTDTAGKRSESANDTGSMTVLEHIAELRNTLIWALGLAAVAAIAAWFFSSRVLEILFRPIHAAGEDMLYFQAPMDAFILRLKTSAVIGLLIVLPLILLKLYQFVLPGLHAKEKRVVTPLLVGATSLFYVGVGFCFLVLLPLVIDFALGFATETLRPLLTATAYFDMAAKLCLAFGLLFELPMVVFALSWAGVVDPKVLLKGWRYALVMILLTAAVLTPPDIISQVMLGGPVMVLYMASVLISMLVRKRQRKEKERQREIDRQEEIALREAERRERAEKEREMAERDAAERAEEQRELRRRRNEQKRRELAERRAREQGDEPAGGTEESDETDGDAKDDLEDPDRERPARPRPAPGTQPRLEPAPDHDPEADDPPWVRPLDQDEDREDVDDQGPDGDDEGGVDRGPDDDDRRGGGGGRESN